MIRVAIVDDDALIRQTVGMLFETTPDIRLVGSFETALDAINGVPFCSPDLVLVDVAMPGVSGIECMPLFRSLFPYVKFLMHSGCDDSETIQSALSAGAAGFVSKRVGMNDLFDAVRNALAGSTRMVWGVAESH